MTKIFCICLFSIPIYFLMKCLFKYFASFLLGCLIPYYWVLRILYMYSIQLLYQICDWQTFSQKLWFIFFILFTVFFNDWNLNEVQFMFFFHINEDLVNVSLDLKSGFKVTNTFSCIFIWKHTEALLTSMIHFELVFMWCDVEIKLICFAYGYTIAPDSNFEKTIISLSIFLRISVDNQFVYMCMCICLYVYVYVFSHFVDGLFFFLLLSFILRNESSVTYVVFRYLLQVCSLLFYPLKKVLQQNF